MDQVRYVIQQRRRYDYDGKPIEPMEDDWITSDRNDLAFWSYYTHSLDAVPTEQTPLYQGQKELVDELNEQLPHLEFRVVQEVRVYRKKVV